MRVKKNLHTARSLKGMVNALTVMMENNGDLDYGEIKNELAQLLTIEKTSRTLYFNIMEEYLRREDVASHPEAVQQCIELCHNRR